MTTYTDTQLARDTQARLLAGEQVDGEAGDMTAEGWRAYRLDTVIVVSDCDGGLGAHEFDSAKAAEKALDALKDRPALPGPAA